MPSPTINFRLTPYQIARGLWMVRKVAPSYIPTSCAQLVKMIYNDYLAKMSYGHTDIVPPEYIAEVYQMLGKTRTKPTTISDVVQSEADIELLRDIKSQPSKHETQSTISTVTDLRPPTDWMDE